MNRRRRVAIRVASTPNGIKVIRPTVVTPGDDTQQHPFLKGFGSSYVVKMGTAPAKTFDPIRVQRRSSNRAIGKAWGKVGRSLDNAIIRVAKDEGPQEGTLGGTRRSFSALD